MTPKASKHPILVPIDFSPGSEAAILQAAELAEALQAPVTILHIVHDLTATPGYKELKGAKKQLVCEGASTYARPEAKTCAWNR